MIFFDWQKIKTVTHCNCGQCLRIVEVLAGVRTPTKLDMMILAKLKDQKKLNWLNRPKDFFKANASDNDKCVYLELSSLRNRYIVETTGKNHIPLHFLDLTPFKIRKLKWNNLLQIENDGIYFKY